MFSYIVNLCGKVNSETVTSSDKIQAMKLIDFVNTHYLTQMVVTPTRQDNILDYVFVNKENFIKNIEIQMNSYLSDHNTITAEVDFIGISNVEDKKTNFCDTVIPEYDLMAASEEQWNEARAWKEAIDYKDVEND